MRKGVRDKLIDDVMEAYVDWRQAAADVEFAYHRWSSAPASDPAGGFAAYDEAVNREELASLSYAYVTRRAVQALARDRRRRARLARNRNRMAARRPRRRGRSRRGASS